jgi:hypothetical protein
MTNIIAYANFFRDVVITLPMKLPGAPGLALETWETANADA